jgi:hypothetical protein
MALLDELFEQPAGAFSLCYAYGTIETLEYNIVLPPLLGFRNVHTSLTLKLNAPPAFLYDFLRAWDRTDNASSPFCFSFAHDGIGSTAFLFHEGEGVCAK